MADQRPIVRVLPDGAPTSAEAVVVIDVIRAFTTSAAAFANGAERILCVEHSDEARRLRAELTGSVLMGEERGLPPAEFDLGNSPVEPTAAIVGGRTLVQRTSNGTRGLIAAQPARWIAAAGATTVTATARWLAALGPSSVDILATGATSEDRACGDHLAALLLGETPDPAVLHDAVVAAAEEHVAFWTRRRDSPALVRFRADIETCAAVDLHPFAMPGRVLDATTVELRRHDLDR